MYKELFEFAGSLAKERRTLFCDGEFWTSAIIAVCASPLFFAFPSLIDGIRSHFGEALNVTGLIFGFELTALFFCIQSADQWCNDDRVAKVADRLVLWHVWTVFCLLFQIVYILVIWAIGKSTVLGPTATNIAFAMLVFVGCYSVFQIINHVLTLRWIFRERQTLRKNT